MKSKYNYNKSTLLVHALVGLSIGFSISGYGAILEEVIVTAQKRAQSMQDVPIAVSAITSDQLSDTGFRDITDLPAQVPSLMVTTNVSPVQTSFRIRRIGNEGNIPTFEPATALYIDGAFRSRSALGLGDLVDVKSIEVLKGPQSTLYGKNATAGVISVNTEGPTDDIQAMGEFSYGSYSYRQFKGYISGPLSHKLSGRLSIQDTQRDSLVENLVGPDADSLSGKAVRGQLRYDFTDRLTARLIVGLAERDMLPQLPDQFYSPAHIAIIRNSGGRVTNNDPNDRTVENFDNIPFILDAEDGILRVEYMGGNYKLTSISSFDNYDANTITLGVEGMPLKLARGADLQVGTSLSQELRLIFDRGSRFDWLVGAFYYKNEFDRGDRNRPELELEEDIEEYGGAVAAQIGGLPTSSEAPILGVEGDSGDFLMKQDSRALGAFSQAGVRFADSLELRVGLRYSWEEKAGSIVMSNQTSALGCVPPLNTNVVCLITPNGTSDFDGDDEWSKVTGSASLSYFVTDGVMFYATYATGFKAGGFSLQFGQATEQSRPFDQEEVTNMELGWKSEFWSQRARVNGAVFHTTYDNFQNASFISPVFAVNNAEKVTVDGIEIDSTWLLTDKLTTNINAAYIDAVYDKYTGGQCFFGRNPDNEELGQCDLSGNNLPFAPKLTGNIALQWEQPIMAGDLYARLDYRYTGEANYSSELDPRHNEDGYGIVNFRLGWRSAWFELSGWVRNLTDKTWFVQKAPGNFTTAVDAAVGSSVGSFQTFTGPQRTYGATLRLNL